MAAADGLKARLKAVGELLPEPTRVRIHRAISWLKRAEAESTDHDARFIFLWIAFNAAYGQDFGLDETERDMLRTFLQKLVTADAKGALQKLVFDKFSGPVRVLIENKFVFHPFWRALREHDSSDQWKAHFEQDGKLALKAVFRKDTVAVLTVIFDRLYVLRNQLVHGGATWNSKINRQQVRDGAEMLHLLLPAMISLMLDHPTLDLGTIAFPVI